jgi:haloalkane dehalogenase
VAATEVKRAGRLAYREAVPEAESGAPVLLVHGFPESSSMWRELITPIAASGRRAVAPDLIGYGDSPPDRPATWERHIEALGEFAAELELGPVALVVHDWGGLIGLRWACDNPGAVTAIVASNTGLFPEGKWHGFAEAMRTEGQGEELMEQMTRDALAATLRAQSDGFDDEAIDEYWKAFETDDGRMGILEMYRSGDFSKLEPYRGKLAALEVPFLALWGEDDPFAPIAGAYRFQREIPGAEVVAVEGAGHFVYADDPERCAREVVAFLGEAPR